MTRVATAALYGALALSTATVTAWAAKAPENAQPTNSKGVEVGVGVVCNTQQQVARFAELSDQSGDAAKAIKTVNTEANNPTACAAMAVAFVRGKEVAEVHRSKDSLEVAEITIVAVPDGNKWQMVSPIKQYTAFPVKGIEI